MAEPLGRAAQLAADIAALDAEAEVLIGSGDPSPTETNDADPPAPAPRTFKEERLAEYAKSKESTQADPEPASAPAEDPAMLLLREEIESLRTAKEQAEAEAETRASRAVEAERSQFAKERAERDAVEAERAKRLNELEEAQRKAAIKLTAEERIALVDKYGEEEAKDRQAMIEESRQTRFDNETLSRKMAELEARMNKPQAPATATQQSQATDPEASKINESFAPFNEVAKPFGSWQSFTKSDRFKEIASDPEFNELFMEAFTRRDGLVVGVKPSIAKAAHARLAELMKDKAVSRSAPSLQSGQAKMDTRSVDDDKADEMSPAEYSRQLRESARKGTLAEFGKKLDQTLKRTIN